MHLSIERLHDLLLHSNSSSFGEQWSIGVIHFVPQRYSPWSSEQCRIDPIDHIYSLQGALTGAYM